MELKSIYLFIFICVQAIAAEKYGHISDCIFYDRSIITGIDNVTFICGKYSNENGVFIDTRFHCSNYNRNVYDYYPGTIDFRSCRFTKFERNFFEQFPRMHTFIISNIELEVLQREIFREAKNVSNLIASHNRISEIPALLLTNAVKLKFADFSNNTIERVDVLGLMGAKALETLNLTLNQITSLDEDVFKDSTNLKFLNLSHNQLTELHSNLLSTPNLLTLDLSKNILTKLNEHTFDKTVQLKHLDLSFNSIGNVNVQVFAFMPELEVLNLRKTNISSIQLGTFSHQHKLIILDLAENQLKEINFNLFMPILADLQSLYLSENQLTDLSGFRNSLFPQLVFLDIKNNNFNCSYLIDFMASVNWEEIRLPVDPKSVKPGETGIRGVKCTVTTQTDPNQNKEKCSTTTASVTHENDSGVVKVAVIFMCIVMSIFVIIFFILNKNKISSEFRNSPVSRSLNSAVSSTTLNVAFANEELLLK